MAVDLMHTIETSLSVNLTVADLLQSPSLSQLASQIFDSLEARPKEVRTPQAVKSEQQEFPLSYGQQALWFLHQLAPESAAYSIAAAARIHSALDVVAFQQALQKLVERHPALRTTFPVESDTPVQRIHEFMTISFTRRRLVTWMRLR